MAEPEWEGVVPAAAEGQRLDQLLAGPLGSRARAARLIAAGLVRVDGSELAKRHSVRAGERITVARERPGPVAASGPQAARFAVVFEDEWLIVVDKPAGVVVHPARGHMTGTLAQALADRAGGGDDPQRPGIVHRLDRDTSGLLVVAKSDAVHRRLKAMLAERSLQREYLALVEGIPPARTGTIEAPIGRDRHDRLRHSLDSDSPRAAVTHFELAETLPHAALLRVRLETGRTHQIRVHLQAIGHPLIGDRVYGGPLRFGLERQFLHAEHLAFTHPVTGEPVDVRAALPGDLAAALATARAALA
jgi:23S rRNA pseudouridine1911/1915/1917 synthase